MNTGSPLKFLLITFLVWVNIAYSGTTGKLAGKVTDVETGEPLPGVNIIIEETSLGAAADEDGTYYILRIPPGTYDVRASMIGYNDVRVKNVRIRMDLTTIVNFEMALGVVGLEEVTIIAERPLVQPDVTYSQANISSDEISALPIEEFEEVVALQAGVVLGSDGALHVRGGRGSEIVYLIDGVSVTDPFTARMGIEIETNAIQELQFISGTFNAEYGQAMSGVVNIVTKDGSYNRYSGNLQFNLGDFWSQDTALFGYIDNFNLNGLKDLQGSFNGPLPFFFGTGSFFLSGRYFFDEGYLFGQRRYLPDSYVQNPQTTRWELEKLGDGDSVPLNWVEQFTRQGKLSFKFGGGSKVSLNYAGSNTRFRTYTHKFKYNPDGDYNRFRKNSSIITKIEQSLSPSTFFILSFSQAQNKYYYYVHKDPTDTTRYSVDPNVFSAASGYNFYVGGIRMGHYSRNSLVHTYKLDLLSQLNKLHQVKLGTELRKGKLIEESFSILYNEDTDYLPQIPKVESPQHDEYTRYPFEYSVFLQDKIEYNDLVLNLGLRWDYFEPDWKTLTDLADPNYRQPLKPINQYFDENEDGEISLAEERPDNEKSDEDRLKYWFKKADPTSQFSPRLAVAFPISERGVMHFSYGHFFQIPPNRFLYINPDFEVTPGLSTTMGNADLQPERTTQYEVGFQQQIGSSVVADITGFYKDIRNLLSTKIVDSFIAGDRYALYVNRDYGNSRGVTVSLKKLPSGFISGSFDYTYSISEGNASDPNAAYFDALSGNEPEKQLLALDWDQRHTLNAIVMFHSSKSSGISFIFQYGSGLPYTPSLAGTRIAFENSERKPAQYNVDVRGFWNFKFMGLSASFHLNIYNLFDRRNEVLVYNDTGRADYTLIPTYMPQEQTFNTLDEYLVRPDFYSPPRQLKVGLTIAF